MKIPWWVFYFKDKMNYSYIYKNKNKYQHLNFKYRYIYFRMDIQIINAFLIYNNFIKTIFYKNIIFFPLYYFNVYIYHRIIEILLNSAWLNSGHSHFNFMKYGFGWYLFFPNIIHWIFFYNVIQKEFRDMASVEPKCVLYSCRKT